MSKARGQGLGAGNFETIYCVVTITFLFKDKSRPSPFLIRTNHISYFSWYKVHRQVVWVKREWNVSFKCSDQTHVQCGCYF